MDHRSTVDLAPEHRQRPGDAGAAPEAPRPVERRPKALRAVLFACDGLLADSAGCWAQARAERFEAHGLPYGPAEDAALRALSPAGAAAVMAKRFGLGGDPRALAEIEEEVVRAGVARLRAGCRPMPGARQFVIRVGRRLPVAILSPLPRVALDATLTAVGLAEAAAVTVAGDEVDAPWPAPDLHLAACRALGIATRHVLAFEAGAEGLRAARAAGPATVGVLAPGTDGTAGATGVPAPAHAPVPCGPPAPRPAPVEPPAPPRADHLAPSLADPRLLAWIDGWA
ncbi:HAD family hydrolase [Streptomyces sp. BI20]|uniref:HAD family hydrolase n=1 Tax=Streptomyces sp. BI20 TaxID=3403460 RepID=UPI003C70A6D6